MNWTGLAFGTMAAVALLAQGCGGGGSDGDSGQVYSGAMSQATIDAGNAEALARAGAAGAGQSVASDSTPAVFRSPTDQNAKLRDLSVRLIRLLENREGSSAARGAGARTENYSSLLCPGGGSAVLTVPDSANPSHYSFSFEFTNCTDDSLAGVTFIYDGTVRASYAEGSGGFSFEVSFQNFAITVVDAYTHSATINLTMACSGTDTVGYSDATCTYYSDFTGFDGRTYRVANVTIYGDGSSGYTITATVYHPDYGYVEVTTTTPVTFQCSSGYPDSGTLVLSGGGGSTATVNFVSCGEYTVTHNGTTTSYFW